MSTGATLSWINTPLDARRGLESVSFRCRSSFGSFQPCWFSSDHEPSFTKVRVAAEYSDSLPDSGKSTSNHGYHPLEDVKERRKKESSLSDAETARTVVEANRNALVVFPAWVHREPHGQITWSEFRYVIDDYGDIFFELPDDENILRDHGVYSRAKVLIGMDTPIFGASGRIDDESNDDDVVNKVLDEDDLEVDTEITDVLIKWGMPNTMRRIHPVYFAKCMSKAVDANYAKKMHSPSNALSILGYLRPAFLEEESYLRSLFDDCSNDNTSDWTDESNIERGEVAGTDGETLGFDLQGDRSEISSRIYKLEILTIELFTMYGNQSMVSMHDFQDAEPDLLAHSASTIIERINQYGTLCSTALRSLCRKRRGLTVEGAKLIGVDSLGIDVRVFTGKEAKTIRFPFRTRAVSENAAEKMIKRMLFARYYRKDPRTLSDGVPDR